MDERWQRVQTTISAYERYATDFAEKPDDRRWLRPLVDSFSALLSPRSLVLDLGCASGRETVELQAAGLRVVGFDLTAAFLRIAQARYPSVGYLRGDALHLPLASQSLDGVWAMASLLHLAPGEAGSALAEVRRVLRPGGAFYSSLQIGSAVGMVAPQAGEAVQADRYYAFYEPEAWRARLERAGFEVVRFDALELDPEQASASCNLGARGWINAFARRPHG
ncbi:MAG: class I SAM-dependent methyltransferase [Dehalococcoidia bacterium]